MANSENMLTSTGKQMEMLCTQHTGQHDTVRWNDAQKCVLKNEISWEKQGKRVSVESRIER